MKVKIDNIEQFLDDKLSIIEKIDKYYILGRWLGDGIKNTKSNIIIARGNEKDELRAMGLISKYLNVIYIHDNKGMITRFHKTKKLNLWFNEILNNINNNKFNDFNDIEMFLIIAGFLDSDGSVDYYSPNAVGKLSKNKIKLVFYNNNINILTFIKLFLNKKGIVSNLCESYHGIANMNVEDNCWGLHINECISNYYLGYKLIKHMLHIKKRNRIIKWLEIYNNYYLNKGLIFTEIFSSIEGEGRDSGVPKTFLRVKGCPHHCSYCDSKYSAGSNTSGCYKSPPLKNTIKKVIETGRLEKIEFTGGSPDWRPMMIGYLLAFFKTHFNSHITMQVSGGIKTIKSYKLFISSDLNCFDYKDPRENIPFVIEDKLIREQDEIKFLIKDDYSYNFVKNKIKELSKKLKCCFSITTVTNNSNNVIEQHLCDYQKLVCKILKDKEFPKNIIIYPRLQILVWGNKRGV